MFCFLFFDFPFVKRNSVRCSYIVHVTLSENEGVTDFYVETKIDGMHKGVFRSDTPVNWHRKHKQHHTNYGDHSQTKDEFRNRKIFSTNFINNNVSTMMSPVKKIRVDESGIEIPNNNVERHMTASIPSKNVLALNTSTSMGKRTKRMKMSSHIIDHCTQEFWSENGIPDSPTNQFTRRWSYSKADLINKTVSFRCVLITTKKKKYKIIVSLHSSLKLFTLVE